MLIGVCAWAGTAANASPTARPKAASTVFLIFPPHGVLDGHALALTISDGTQTRIPGTSPLRLINHRAQQPPRIVQLQKPAAGERCRDGRKNHRRRNSIATPQTPRWLSAQ